MGLFYTPNPPHIGAQQPLEAKKLTPPSGSAPSNPPFMGGSAVHKAILGCWAAATIVAAIMPVMAKNLTPPSAPSAPAGTGVIFDTQSTSPITGLGGTSFSDGTKLTIGNNPNRALIVQLCLTGNPSLFSLTWDGVALTQLATVTDAFNTTTQLYGLRNPNVGTKVLAGSWTNTEDFVANAISLYNVDQTSDAIAFPGAVTSTGTTSPASVTVASAPGDMVVAAHTLLSSTATFTAVNNTQSFRTQNNSIAAAGNRASGAASVAMTATESTNTVWSSAGVDIMAVRTLPSRWPQEATIAAWIPPAPAPITGPDLTPPSGVAAAAFPFRGSRVPIEVMASWLPPAFVPILQENLSPPVSGTSIPSLFTELSPAILSAWQSVAFTPIVQENLTPPVSAPQNPPFAGGARVPAEVQLAWAPPVPLPITVDNLVPPIAGPSPQNPPFNGGARVSGEILISWIPPPPAPITVDNLVPPIAGPTPQNPPFMGGSEVPAAVLISWLPLAPAPITGAELPPQPVVAVVPPAPLSQAILSSWQNVPWPVISGEQLTPPSGPSFPPAPILSQAILSAWQVASPPSFILTPDFITPPISGPPPQPLIGSLVRQEILNSWLPAAYAPMVADNFVAILAPTPSAAPPGGAMAPVAMPDEWAPIVARNLSPPISGPSPSNPPFAGGARVKTEILVGWIPPPPAPIVGPKYTLGAQPPLTPPFVGGARVPLEVQIGWLPPAPMSIVGPKYTPSGPAPTNPPLVGSRLTVETQVNWVAPATLPTLPVSAAPLLPVVAQQPPFIALSQAILASWVLETRPVISAAKATPPSAPTFPPLIGSRVSIEILANWLPAAFAPLTGPDLTPPSGPTLPPLIGSVIPTATFAWHVAPPQVLLPPAFFTPSAAAFPFTGSAVPSAIFAWHGIAPQPQIPRLLPPTAQAFYPFVGTRVPREVLQSWEFVAQPIYRRAQVTISGPIASQPPLGGGSIIRLSVLVNWIPPPPMPALPRASMVVSLPPTSIVFPQPSLKGFEPPTNLSGVEPTPSLKGIDNDPSLKGD